MPPLAVLISGAVLMGYLVAGLFFFRFWKETQDRLRWFAYLLILYAIFF